MIEEKLRKLINEQRAIIKDSNTDTSIGIELILKMVENILLESVSNDNDLILENHL